MQAPQLCLKSLKMSSLETRSDSISVKICTKNIFLFCFRDTINKYLNLKCIFLEIHLEYLLSC